MHRKKIFDHLALAEKSITSAKNILNVVFPISLDQKILLKSLEKTHDALIHVMSFVLKFEHLKKKIVLSKDRQENERMFFDCLANHGLSVEDMDDLHKILSYAASHKASAVEFSRQEYLVLMNDNLDTVELYKEDLGRYIDAVDRLIGDVLSRNFQVKRTFN